MIGLATLNSKNPGPDNKAKGLAHRAATAATRGARRFRHRVPVTLALTCVFLLLSSLANLHSRPARAHQLVAPGTVVQAANRGPFSLIDHHGRAVTNEDFLGSYMLVYFGYTHCPDLCPIDLQVMIEAIDLMGPQGAKIQPVFITVDPKRDTVEVMAGYVAGFHPHLIGLTGTSEQVAEASGTYRVQSRKFFPVDLDGGGGESQDGEDVPYLVEHSAAFFLIGPDGGGLVQYAHGITAEEIAKDIQQFLDQPPR